MLPTKKRIGVPNSGGRERWRGDQNFRATKLEMTAVVKKNCRDGQQCGRGGGRVMAIE